ncbi:hypothetical protein DPMN_142882 [Dreissena polymorpha]|uniref:Uncharacterized protein n=1 Tax=Dreissena polymorpha TaxID=45954 RepID=A0A9D4JJ45_DREPO|nr:hypothetical protein DPMN_142882 [Dreissena polymorpha]
MEMFSYRVTVLCANRRRIQQLSLVQSSPGLSHTHTYMRQRRQLTAYTTLDGLQSTFNQCHGRGWNDLQKHSTYTQTFDNQ